MTDVIRWLWCYHCQALRRHKQGIAGFHYCVECETGRHLFGCTLTELLAKPGESV